MTLGVSGSVLYISHQGGEMKDLVKFFTEHTVVVAGIIVVCSFVIFLWRWKEVKKNKAEAIKIANSNIAQVANPFPIDGTVAIPD